MNWNWEAIEAGVEVIGGLLIMAALGAGVIVGIVYVVCAILRKLEEIQSIKAGRLLQVMAKAAPMPLPEAIQTLADAGMYFNFGAKWRGQSLKLPKSFWWCNEHSFAADLKAITLVTIATWVMENKPVGNYGWEIAQGFLESLTMQASKTPVRVVSVVGLLAQRIAGNAKLSSFMEQLEYMGRYHA